MPNFHSNPLFRRASKKAQGAARRQWKETTAAQAVDQLHEAVRRGGPMRSGDGIRKALHQWSRGTVGGALRSLGMTRDLSDAINEIQQYSKQSGTAASVISKFLGDIGPVGSLIKSVLSGSRSKRSSGLEGDIQSALDFLDAVAPETLSSHGRKRTTKNKQKANRNLLDIAEQIDTATEFLEQQGFAVRPATGSPKSKSKSPRQPGTVEADDPTPSSEEKTYPQGKSKTTNKGTPRKVVDLEINGRMRRFSVSHPIVTKRMILTPESSNVWSYSYSIDTSTLYVRYRSHMVHGTAGSLYSYANVPADVFLKMYTSPSKGTFIWDNIRIRGTISGHRYDYSLVAVRQNHVPRKATMTPRGEMLVPRTVRVKRVNTGKIRTLKSGGEMRPGAHLYR